MASAYETKVPAELIASEGFSAPASAPAAAAEISIVQHIISHASIREGRMKFSEYVAGGRDKVIDSTPNERQRT